MKIRCHLITIILAIIFSAYLLAFCLGSKAHTKREESMMEFFAEKFHPEKANEEWPNFRFKGSSAKNEEIFISKQKPKPKPKPTNKTKSKGKAGKPSSDNELLQEWFMIQSEAFRNKRLFPLIKIPSGKYASIEITSENFRINQAFDYLSGKDKPPSNLFFFFRLVGLHVYYTDSKSNVNILGTFDIEAIHKISFQEGPATLVNQTICFEIKDTEHNTWLICGTKKATVRKWVCRIEKLLKINDATCEPDYKEPIYLDKKINQPIIVVPTSRFCNDEWNYHLNGRDWECDCVEGKEQSPIDLPLPSNAIESPVRPLFQYEEVSSLSEESTSDELLTKGEYLNLVLKDNALRLFHSSFGKVTTVDGAVYRAQEIVFHVPSEHSINGKFYDMEVQIIHFGQSVGDIGKQMILSFLVEKTPGVYNKFFDDLDFFNLPNQIAPERELTSHIFIPKIFYDTEDKEYPVMKHFSFYTYQGSLTFPPCTESTIVYVASQPIKLGSTAIQLFEESLRVPDFKDAKDNIIISTAPLISSREVQPLNGRPVFFFDHEKYCGPDPPKSTIKRGGHFEKIMKAETEYFYVNSRTPSGMPGAYLVSETEAKEDQLK